MRATSSSLSSHGLHAHSEHPAETAQLLVRAEALIVGGDQHQIGGIVLEHIARRELSERRWSCREPGGPISASAPLRCTGGAHTWMRRASIA